MTLNPIRIFRTLREMPGRLRNLEAKTEELEKCLEEERQKRYTLGKSVEYLQAKLTPPSEYPRELAAWYFRWTGKKLDLKNPKTYNEKIQWYKMYGLTPEITRLADKIAVREYVKETIGEKYLIPLLGIWETPEDIDFFSLPDQFVLKANHGSGYNYVVRDKKNADLGDIIEKAHRWLAEDFAFTFGFEMQYHNIHRRLLAEQYMDSGDGDLNDCKLRCFNGRVEMLSIGTGRRNGLHIDFFDRKWNRLPIKYNNYPTSEKEIPRPENLEEIIEVGERLAGKFPQVRVDLYLMNDGRIYFGEMTFTSASGVATWDPPEIDAKIGELFTYPGLEK